MFGSAIAGESLGVLNLFRCLVLLVQIMDLHLLWDNRGFQKEGNGRGLACRARCTILGWEMRMHLLSIQSRTSRGQPIGNNLVLKPIVMNSLSTITLRSNPTIGSGWRIGCIASNRP